MFTLLNADERARQPGRFVICLVSRGRISNLLPQRQSLICGEEQGACQTIAQRRAFAQPITDHALGKSVERGWLSRLEKLTGLRKTIFQSRTSQVAAPDNCFTSYAISTDAVPRRNVRIESIKQVTFHSTMIISGVCFVLLAAGIALELSTGIVIWNGYVGDLLLASSLIGFVHLCMRYPMSFRAQDS